MDEKLALEKHVLLLPKQALTTVDIKLAIQLIEAAARAGADAVNSTL